MNLASSGEPESEIQGRAAILSLERDFETACAGSVPRVRAYGLASFGLHLHLAGAHTLSPLTAAFEHLGDPTARGEHQLHIRAWSGSRPQLFDQVVPLLGCRKQISVLGDRIHLSVEQGGQVISAYDRCSRRAYFWCHDPRNLPGYMLANPFRLLLHWWLQPLPLQFVHAAAVGRDGRAVLIVGNSGAGKSTTALACVASGLTYLADDYCICTLEAQPLVYSVYQSAKIERTNLSSRLPAWMPHAINPTEADKAVVFVDQLRPRQLRRRAQLAAVLIPGLSDAGPGGRLYSASKLDALRAIAPSSLLQMPGQGPEDFRALRSLVESLPAYHLSLSPQLHRNSEQIGDLLDRL